jgi:hypothetical protein
MKKIKFSDNLISLVISKKKNTTWRVNDDKDITEGDSLSLCNTQGEEFARARVISAITKTFRELNNEDKEGHENFSSEEEMYKTYSNYYKDNTTPNTRLKIIKFELLQ